MSYALFTANSDMWEPYKEMLERAFHEAKLDISLTRDASSPEKFEYIIFAPSGPVQDFTPFTNVKLIQSLWAGVEVAMKNKTLTQPLARMVDNGMSEGMSDYVLGHVMRYHLGMDAHISAPIRSWEQNAPCLARQRTVGFLGLGELGMFCARAATRQGFNVLGWSRTQKRDEAVNCYAGQEGLQTVLEQSDILILLMPDTPDTANIINAETIAKMKYGVKIINPGRGTLINDADLIDALKSGHVAAATLDVFRTEPLPKDDPYWVHSNVLVTPHIASETRLKTAVPVVVDNIKRGEMGQPFLHLVDRSVGY